MTEQRDHIEEERSRQEYSSYVVKLLWRVIGKIKPENLSFNDKDVNDNAKVYQQIIQ